MTDWHDVSVFPHALIASRTVPLALPETMCNASREQMRLSQVGGSRLRLASGLLKTIRTRSPCLLNEVSYDTPVVPLGKSYQDRCVDAFALVRAGCSVAMRSRNFSQNSRYSFERSVRGAVPVAALTCFPQSFGCATRLKFGASVESPMRTTSISAPKNRLSGSVCSFSQSRAARCSGRNPVVTQTMVLASVPAARVRI